MSQQEYPHALDFAWIASDGQEHVAVFITAGEGPILAQALRGDFFPVKEVEPRVLRLSIRPDQAVTYLSDAPNPSSYIALAQRGVFVYDWTDFTSVRESLNAYELVARPVMPITCADLPTDLREVAQAVRFPDLCFADTRLVAVK